MCLCACFVFLSKKHHKSKSEQVFIQHQLFQKHKRSKTKNKQRKVSNYMTILHILRKKNLHQHINLKKRPLISKTFIKRRKFFYLNRQIFVSHRTFLHHRRLYLQGKSNEFDQESLNRKAFTQHRALSYHQNKGGKINPAFFPDICITYNSAREEPSTPEQEEEVFVPFVTQSFY